MIMKVSIYDDSYNSKPLIKAGSRVKYCEAGYENDWELALVKDYNEYGITFILTDGEEIEGYIGITEDDWGKYSVYSYKLTGVRVANAIPKTYDNSSEKGKEELKELYDILMQTRRELGRRKFKDLAILYDNYYDVFLRLIEDIIEIEEV